MAPVSTMASSTSEARAWARGRSRRGEKTEGARVSVASIAAWGKVRLRAETPK